MMAGAGKRKGSAFEREVCKKLSLWVSNGEHEDLFWRSSLSGGRSTVAHKKGKLVRQAGDICAVEKAGHPLTNQWYIECKFYKSIDLDSWLIKETGKLTVWWKRCKNEAHRYGKDPMLIVKQNGWPVLVVTKHNHLAHITLPVIQACWYSADVYLFTDLIQKPCPYIEEQHK